MALTADQITAQNFKDFFGQIRPYLGISHAGFTPIGTVIAVMGNSAPLNYLACDGTEYNITAYPELAAYFTAQFGSVNFFGGDGTTTFAVPDLRGEFLRGTGTNSHTNQGSGANVGVHQDATEHNNTWSSSQNHGTSGYNVDGTSDYIFPQNVDSKITDSNYISRYDTGSPFSDVRFANRYTSRPTNTSVLYCIACKNIFMDAGANYTTDEQVVGTWIDGKPLYQKSYQLNVDVGPSFTHDIISTKNLDIDIVRFDGTLLFSDEYYPMNFYRSSSEFGITLVAKNNNHRNDLTVKSGSSGKVIECTIQYTKTTD